MSEHWFTLADENEANSPALLVYPDRVRKNIETMLSMAGSAARLRPHVKTHKLREVVALQMNLGVTKFKAATIAEAEMVAGCNAPDVLLAYPLAGPNTMRFLQLVKKFPRTKFSAIGDDETALRHLSRDAADAGTEIEVLLDVDCGQHRTGVLPGESAVALYRLLSSLPGLKAGGLHAYDGHVHDGDLEIRRREADAAFEMVETFRKELARLGLAVPKIVMGGTPTFPIHARRPGVECTPGTCIFWDHGYGTNFPDMDFLPAALVLTRVISKPGQNRLCLDLGHKAIASENPPPRVQFLNLSGAKAISHNEEHLVVEVSGAANWKVGDCLYGVPWHICPTVALHSEAVIVENGRATAKWKVLARDRTITV